MVCTSAAEKFNVPVRLTATMYLPPSDVTSTWAATNWKEKVLHSFCSQPNCADGDYPTAGLIFDAAGNLYGTTYAGGAYGAYGPGTVFELTPAAGGGWTEKVLHSFDNDCTDGASPYASLIFDAAGNLYGTTSRRRLLPACDAGEGCGTVFELTPTAGGGWTEKVLHSFGNGTDGANPDCDLIFDAAGNLYGTTIYGGTYSYGTVFELTPAGGGNWTEKVLHNFNRNGTDGICPYAGLIFDAAGNLYGTTSLGGTFGVGTVFELTPKRAGAGRRRCCTASRADQRHGRGTALTPA